jgi:hypothetical protein
VADDATVENDSVAVPPLLLTAAGVVVPNEHVACDGLNVTVEVTVHARLTVPLYPFACDTAIAAVDVPPGLIDAGLGAPAESE